MRPTWSDIFSVRIDKNRKLPVTCLIRAVGPQTEAEILEMFGEEPLLVSTLEKDTCKTREESMLEIYRKLRPGEPPTLDSAESLINSLFFDARRYDLSPWAVISSIRSSPCGLVSPAKSWQPLWPIPARARSLPKQDRT